MERKNIQVYVFKNMNDDFYTLFFGKIPRREISGSFDCSPGGILTGGAQVLSSPLVLFQNTPKFQMWMVSVDGGLLISLQLTSALSFNL